MEDYVAHLAEVQTFYKKDFKSMWKKWLMAGSILTPECIVSASGNSEAQGIKEEHFL